MFPKLIELSGARSARRLDPPAAIDATAEHAKKTPRPTAAASGFSGPTAATKAAPMTILAGNGSR